MNEKITEWLKKMPEDKRREVLARIQKCADRDGILALAAECNVPVSDEVVESILQALNSPKILSEEDLTLIAGGTFNGATSVPMSGSGGNGRSSICD